MKKTFDCDKTIEAAALPLYLLPYSSQTFRPDADVETLIKRPRIQPSLLFLRLVITPFSVSGCRFFNSF